MQIKPSKTSSIVSRISSFIKKSSNKFYFLIDNDNDNNNDNNENNNVEHDKKEYHTKDNNININNCNIGNDNNRHNISVNTTNYYYDNSFK